MRRSLAFVLPWVMCLSVACGDDETTGNGGSKGSSIDDLGPGWTTFAPGGETRCARGTPFKYFVRRGSVNRVVIDFRGGGACWDQPTCSLTGANSLFQEDAEPDAFIADESRARGFYDHNDSRNPFKDWHHVYIPYCTGDIHWGENDKTYTNASGDKSFTINHRGATNVKAVLDWVYQNVASPEKLFVTGCSAGAYGSIIWSSYVKNHYKTAKVYQFADSGAGIITDDFFKLSFPSWNASKNFPTFIPGVDPTTLTRLPQLYDAIGKHFNDMFLSAYNTTYDENQYFYYKAMGGGTVNEWSEKMLASVAQIEAATLNFHAYIAPDFQHCILPYPEFYDRTSNGVMLINWLSDVINDRPVESVSCGANCGMPQPVP